MLKPEENIHELPVRSGGSKFKAFVRTLNHNKTTMSPQPMLGDLASEEAGLNTTNSRSWSIHVLA